jgi:hypothetical protein
MSTKHIEEIHDLHSSGNIIPFFKSRMKWAGYVKHRRRGYERCIQDFGEKT